MAIYQEKDKEFDIKANFPANIVVLLKKVDAYLVKLSLAISAKGYAIPNEFIDAISDITWEPQYLSEMYIFLADNKKAIPVRLVKKILESPDETPTSNIIYWYLQTPERRREIPNKILMRCINAAQSRYSLSVMVETFISKGFKVPIEMLDRILSEKGFDNLKLMDEYVYVFRAIREIHIETMKEFRGPDQNERYYSNMLTELEKKYPAVLKHFYSYES